MDATKEKSVDPAVAAVLSELDGISTLKNNKKWHCRLFSVVWLFSQLTLARVQLNAGVHSICPRGSDALLLLCSGKSDWSAQSSSKFCPLFQGAFYGLFSRWTREINPKDFGNVSCGVPG